jgi:hypothetical protein
MTWVGSGTATSLAVGGGRLEVGQIDRRRRRAPRATSATFHSLASLGAILTGAGEGQAA